MEERRAVSLCACAAAMGVCRRPLVRVLLSPQVRVSSQAAAATAKRFVVRVHRHGDRRQAKARPRTTPQPQYALRSKVCRTALTTSAC